MEASYNLLLSVPAYIELHFDAILYSKLGNENSSAGHTKCSRGPHSARGGQGPHSWHSCFTPWYHKLSVALFILHMSLSHALGQRSVSRR